VKNFFILKSLVQPVRRFIEKNSSKSIDVNGKKI